MAKELNTFYEEAEIYRNRIESLENLAEELTESKEQLLMELEGVTNQNIGLE